MPLRMEAVAEWHRKPAFIKKFESVLSLQFRVILYSGKYGIS
jgi:hypothetical protein